MSRSYRMKYDCNGLKKDALVFDFSGPTYGVVSDDTADTGVTHKAVTLHKNGLGVFMSVPLDALEPQS